MPFKIAFLVLYFFAPYAADAELSIIAPQPRAALSDTTVIKGSCTKGKGDVKLSGPGIDKNKKISCQKPKSKNQSYFWSYSLENAYKKMPEGEIAFKVAQKSDSVSRIFLKGAAPAPTPTSPPPEPPPQPQQPPPPSAENPAGGKAPGENFNLKIWKITLPIDSAGGFSGTAMEVKPIPTTYQRAPYFYTGADGAMVFMAPVEGARTSGSKYPRSELRELKPDGSLAAWSVRDGGALHATVAVNELPVTSSGAKGRVVVGQIHGPDDELCRLYYDNGKIYFYDDKAGAGLQETQFVLKNASGAVTNIPLNAKFDYAIVVDGNYLTVSVVHQGITYSASDMISSFWPGKPLYFKAGAYVQVGKPGSGAGTTGSGRGQVSFYKLIRTGG